MTYGYARGSTNARSVHPELRQLTRAGCQKVFRETASEAKTERERLRRRLAQLASGEVQSNELTYQSIPFAGQKMVTFAIQRQVLGVSIAASCWEGGSCT